MTKRNEMLRSLDTLPADGRPEYSTLTLPNF